MSLGSFFSRMFGGKADKDKAASEGETATEAPQPSAPAPAPEPAPAPAPEPVPEPEPASPTLVERAADMFKGAAAPLSATGFDAARASLSVAAEALWAVMNVESRGAGFLASGRPKILFEGHWFSRLTGGRFDAAHPDISYPTWTTDHYLGGEREYERLERAITLDRDAALKSTSWGLGQVMGFNAEKAGFANVEDMVAAMSESEDAQLKGMAGFIASEGLDAALNTKDWRRFAEVYNGAGFAQHDYDGRLKAANDTYEAEGLPELGVRSLQSYLERLGFAPGRVDGLWGPRTQAALNQFLAGLGQPAAAAFSPEHVTLLAQAVAQRM